MFHVPFYYFVGIDQSKDFFDVVIKDKRKKIVFSGQFYVNRNGKNSPWQTLKMQRVLETDSNYR